MARDPNEIKVALDRGHGDNTPGKETPFIASLGRRIQEEEYNGPVVELLNKELTRCGFQTLLTAPNRYDTPLGVRTYRANKWGADLFISIHFNALAHTFSYSNASGFSVHIQPSDKSNPNSGSLRFAKFAVEELQKGVKQVNRGIVGQNLHVTRETNMPAALIEGGFMDDEFEANLMLNPSFHKEVARELAVAVCRYFDVDYVPDEVDLNPKYTLDPSHRIGEVVLKTDMNYRTEPSLDAPVIRVLPEGHGIESPVHVYEIDGDWLRLGKGWISNAGGKYATVRLYPPKKPSKNLYKVQIGAFSSYENAKKLQDIALTKGFKSFLSKEGSLYKVQIGAFSKLDNAEELSAEAIRKGLKSYITKEAQ
jgi:N-acetylmuramoyl-L-alanine amidase